jgi:hypothetical protein
VPFTTFSTPLKRGVLRDAETQNRFNLKNARIAAFIAQTRLFFKAGIHKQDSGKSSPNG